MMAATTRRTIARRPYRCEECGGTIPMGDPYVRIVGRPQDRWGGFGQHATHAPGRCQ